MDFPKSVPGVGLVGDRFVDEDPATGRQGSLIPSDWGNAVTLELLNVIQAAGLDPDEAQTDQLLKAIRALVPERSAFARVTGTLALPASAFGIYALADGGAAATVTLPSTDDLVDDTELLLFANHANTATVQVKAVAEQTIQGPAALLSGSTTAFMLPVAGDWVCLRSERAQGRWVVVECFPVAVVAQVQALLSRVTALEGRELPLGLGQADQDMTALRTIGGVVTNTSGRSIEVSVTITVASVATATMTVDGVSGVCRYYNPTSSPVGVTFTKVIRNGGTYSVSGATLVKWMELRA